MAQVPDVSRLKSGEVNLGEFELHLGLCTGSERPVAHWSCAFYMQTLNVSLQAHRSWQSLSTVVLCSVRIHGRLWALTLCVFSVASLNSCGRIASREGLELTLRCSE